jgi:hypothetical protein
VDVRIGYRARTGMSRLRRASTLPRFAPLLRDRAPHRDLRIRSQHWGLSRHESGDVHVGSPTTDQFDLFSSQPAGETASLPPWQALPEETRRKLTKLMAHLIPDHVDGEHAIQRMEAGLVMHSEDQTAPSGAQGDPVCPTVVCPSGPAQPRKQRPAISHARSPGDARLVQHRDGR